MALPSLTQTDLRRSHVSGLATKMLWPNGYMSGGSPSEPLAITTALPSSTACNGHGIDMAKPSTWRVWNAAMALFGAIGAMRISSGL